MNDRNIKILGFLLGALIFIATCTLPTQYRLEFVYSLIVLLTIWIPGNRSTFDSSVVMTALILIAYFINHQFEFQTEAVPTFVYPIFFVWAFTFAIIKYKASQENLIKSTENLNAMFLNATEGIIISNSKGIIVMANPRSCEQFGYEYGDLPGKKIEDLVPRRFSAGHPQHRSKFYSEVHNRSMGKGMNLYALRSDGSEFPVEISLSSFRNKSELFIISFIIDITERKLQEDLIARAQEDLEKRVIERTKALEEANKSLEKANKSISAEMQERRIMEEALRDSERLYSTIARNFPDGIICVVDRQLKIVFIDGKELENLGWKRDHLAGKRLSTIELFLLSEELEKKLISVFGWASTHFELPHQDDTYVVNAVPLPDTKGFIKEILLVIQNVTELKNAEIEIRTSLEKEKELNEMKSKFVSIASHEFRTPLSTILTSVSLIAKYEKTDDLDKRNRHIDRIRSSVKNLTEILNDFLSLEKLEAGKTDVHLAPLNFVEFIEELCEEMQAVSKSGQLIKLKHEGKNMIDGDKQLMRHIMINLVNNAIKYSPEGAEISIYLCVDENITIKVADQGIGIPEADQPHLFDRFFRAGNVTAIQGTGLGLNIVKRYVELMNGTITFESSVEKGTTFIIILPH